MILTWRKQTQVHFNSNPHSPSPKDPASYYASFIQLKHRCRWKTWIRRKACLHPSWPMRKAVFGLPIRGRLRERRVLLAPCFPIFWLPLVIVVVALATSLAKDKDLKLVNSTWVVPTCLDGQAVFFTIPLVLAIIATFCNKSLGLVHKTSLCWALWREDRRNFNTDLLLVGTQALWWRHDRSAWLHGRSVYEATYPAYLWGKGDYHFSSPFITT